MKSTTEGQRRVRNDHPQPVSPAGWPQGPNMILTRERHRFRAARGERDERHPRQGSREERRDVIGDSTLDLILARVSPAQEDEPSRERRL